jgi:hypothetical protein
MKEYIIVSSNSHRHYGFFNFLGDVIMTCLTAGLWLIWVFVREMRGR